MGALFDWPEEEGRGWESHHCLVWFIPALLMSGPNCCNDVTIAHLYWFCLKGAATRREQENLTHWLARTKNGTLCRSILQFATYSVPIDTSSQHQTSCSPTANGFTSVIQLQVHHVRDCCRPLNLDLEFPSGISSPLMSSFSPWHGRQDKESSQQAAQVVQLIEHDCKDSLYACARPCVCTLWFTGWMCWI